MQILTNPLRANFYFAHELTPTLWWGGRNMAELINVFTCLTQFIAAENKGSRPVKNLILYDFA
jgi:hypothetical protein